MKILFVASTASHIVRFHRPYLQYFRNMGWTVDVACGGVPMDIPEARKVIQLPFQKSMTALPNFKAAFILRKKIKIERYTAVSVHTTLAAFFTRLAAVGLNTVLIDTCHGYLFDDNTSLLKKQILYRAERLMARRTDLLLTMNRYDFRFAMEHKLGQKIANIPGVGVNFASFDGQKNHDVREKLKIPANAFVLIFPAEFSKRKSQETLLRTMKLLPERVFLLLPGDGILLEKCQNAAKDFGVAHRVRFPGNVENMVPWYAAADCAVSSSRSEGLPFNVMEAMYLGLPVVATAVKGHEDLIRDGENGLLFPYGDADMCANKIQKLLNDSALAKRLGETAKKDAEMYRLERVAPQVLAAYRQALPELPEWDGSKL